MVGEEKPIAIPAAYTITLSEQEGDLKSSGVARGGAEGAMAPSLIWSVG